MDETPQEMLLTAEEAATMLRVKTGTIYRWVGQGRIPCVRLGRKMTRFRREDLHEFIEQHRAIVVESSLVSRRRAGRARAAVDGKTLHAAP